MQRARPALVQRTPRPALAQRTRLVLEQCTPQRALGHRARTALERRFPQLPWDLPEELAARHAATGMTSSSRANSPCDPLQLRFSDAPCTALHHPDRPGCHRPFQPQVELPDFCDHALCLRERHRDWVSSTPNAEQSVGWVASEKCKSQIISVKMAPYTWCAHTLFCGASVQVSSHHIDSEPSTNALRRRTPTSAAVWLAHKQDGQDSDGRRTSPGCCRVTDASYVRSSVAGRGNRQEFAFFSSLWIGFPNESATADREVSKAFAHWRRREGSTATSWNVL